MLSLIEVKCPHCGAEGQILLPPLGSIIIGPCPECQRMVGVFCGRVFPLDDELMRNGSVEEKREHLGQVLRDFVQERVDKLFAGQMNPAPGAPLEAEAEAASLRKEQTMNDADGISLFGNAPSAPISREELESFITVDLKLIDNREYFKAVFE
jgi:hypothetical protein